MRPKNLGYGFHNIVISRRWLDGIIKDMDVISELSPREGMDLEKMSRVITFHLNPPRYIVRDSQMRNSNGEDFATYTCYVKDGKIKVRKGAQY